MLKKVAEKISMVLYATIIAFTFLTIILSELKTNNILKPNGLLIALPIGVIIIMLLRLLFRVFVGAQSGPSAIVGVLSFVFFVILLMITKEYYFYTAWDPGAVIGMAKALSGDGNVSEYIAYFSRCTNNLTLACTYSIIISFLRFLGIEDAYYACIVFQCFLFSVTSYLVYRVTGMLSDKRNALVSYVLYILVVGLSPWVIVPYSDATGLFFPIFFIFLYLILQQSNKKAVKIIAFISIYLLAPLAFKIKPQLLISVIAITIDLLLTLLQKEKHIKNLLFSASGVIAFLIGFLLVSAYVDSYNINLDNEADYGVWYYLCLGSNIEYNGACNVPDQTYALSYTTKSSRNEALKTLFLQRLKDNGLFGSAKLMTRKNRLNYSDGTFGWFQEDNGHFYREAGPNTQSKMHSYLSSIYYESGSRFYLFTALMQALWYGILFFNIISLINVQTSSKSMVISLALIGLTIFEMIFESRARYLFTYAPLFIVLSESASHIKNPLNKS